MPDPSPWPEAAVGRGSRPLRVGYFGGTFDPPHRGHLAVARAARDRFDLDRVLLAPTGRQPLKPNGPEASWADRLRMTELLCAGEPGLEASAIDAPRPDGQPNYTVETLRRLHAGFADNRPASAAGPPEIFAILGGDAFLGFRQWREPADLFRLADWIVVSRPGIALPSSDLPGPGTREQGARVHLLADVEDPVSATELRDRLHRGESCQDLLPTPVLSYIEQQGLYPRMLR